MNVFVAGDGFLQEIPPGGGAEVVKEAEVHDGLVRYAERWIEIRSVAGADTVANAEALGLVGRLLSALREAQQERDNLGRRLDGLKRGRDERAEQNRARLTEAERVLREIAEFHPRDLYDGPSVADDLQEPARAYFAERAGKELDEIERLREALIRFDPAHGSAANHIAWMRAIIGIRNTRELADARRLLPEGESE